MAQIKEYASQVGTAGPIQGREARGEDFGAQVGQGLSDLGQGVATLGEGIRKHEESLEVSNVNAQMAEAGTQWTQEFQARLKSAPAGDTSFVENFQTDYDAAMDKIGEGIETKAGQQHFDTLRNHQKAHFMESAIAGQAELVKEGVIENHRSFVSNLQNQLIQDPSSYDYVMNTYKAAGDALSDQRQRAKFSEEELPLLEKSRVYGDIRMNPQLAKTNLEAGFYDKLKGTEVEAMIGHANQAISGQHADEERWKRVQEEQAKQVELKTQNDFLQKLNDDKLTSKDILNSSLSPFGSGSKEQFLNLIKSKGQEDLKDNSQFVPLFQAINRPDGDPQKLTDERDLIGQVGNGLTLEGYKSLLSAMQGTNTAAGKAEKKMVDTFLGNMKRQMSTSNDLLRIKDVRGDKDYEDWMVDFLPKYQAERAKGKTPQELLNSKSSTFMGNNVAPKKGTDVIRSNIEYGNSAAANANVPPLIPKSDQWKPGETAADVLSRLKK